MKKSSLVKIIGLFTTAAGMITSLVSDWVSEQKMNEKIDEKVNEALAKKDETENEES